MVVEISQQTSDDEDAAILEINMIMPIQGLQYRHQTLTIPFVIILILARCHSNRAHSLVCV